MDDPARIALLLSGGIDSISVLYWKRPAIAITVDYGQLPFRGEARASKQCCHKLNIQHEIIKVDLADLGSGDLAGTVPTNSAPESEWWPYRNQMLVTIASMKVIDQGIEKLLVGSVGGDDFHIDGTSKFYNVLGELVEMQEGNLKIETPAIEMNSVELVKKSKIPMSLLRMAHSCHTNEFSCGHCRGCYKYIEVMEELKNE